MGSLLVRGLMDAALAFSLVLAPGLAQALPDLRVQLLFATEENEDCKSQVHYIIQIINMSEEPAGAFDMRLVFDAADAPTVENMMSQEGLDIAVGDGIEAFGMHQEEAFWKTATGVAGGMHKSWLLVDPLDEVEEGDETNNLGGPTFFEVNPVVCNPGNLAATQFDAKVEGHTVTYTAGIGNIAGSAVIQEFRVDLFHDRSKPPGYGEAGDDFMLVQGLDAGQTVTFVSTWEQVPDGVFHSYLTVDSLNVEQFEPSEADNLGGPLQVVVCDPCSECPDGVHSEAGCACGGEAHADGTCCSGVWFDGPCPSPEEAQPELVEETPDVVEAVPETTAEPDATVADIAADPSEEATPTPDTQPSDAAHDAAVESDTGGSSGGGCNASAHPCGPAVTSALLLALALLASGRGKREGVSGCARRP
jgi:hypothetical protein